MPSTSSVSVNDSGVPGYNYRRRWYIPREEQNGGWLPVVPAHIINSVATEPQQSQWTTAAENSPLRVIYGTQRIGAQIAVVRPYSQVNGWVFLAVWGQGPIHAISNIYNGPDNTASFGGYIITNYTGSADPGTIDPTLATAILTNWPTAVYTDTLTGIAYSVVVIRTYDAMGFPNLTAQIDGRKVYDPRLDSTNGGSGSHRLNDITTWAWSDNPSLCLADFLSSTVYGMGKTMDWASVITAANFNDTLISGVKSRTLNLAIDSVGETLSWAQTLATYASVSIVPTTEGKYKLVPDTTGSSVATLNTTNILTMGELRRPGLQDVPTVIIVEYTDTSTIPHRSGRATAYAAGVEAGTTPRRESTISLPGITRHAQAYREAVERLNKLTINDLSFSAVVPDFGIRFEVGDIVQVTHPIGLTNKLMRITQSDNTDAGEWNLALAEYNANAYSTDVQSAPANPDTSLPSPLLPPAITGLNTVEEAYQNEDLTKYSRLRATWTAVEWPYTFEHYVELYETGSGVLVFGGKTALSEWVSGPLKENTDYTFKVRVVSMLGALGAQATDTLLVTGDLTSPGPPTDVTVSYINPSYVMKWTPPVDTDIAYYEIREGADFATGTPIATDVIDTRYVLPYPGTGESTYWVRAVDYRGNVSTAVTTAVVPSLNLAAYAYSTSPNFLVYGPDTGSVEGMVAIWNGTAGKFIKMGIANNVLNVKQYGALGDGLQDDGAFIQAAIDAASASASSYVADFTAWNPSDKHANVTLSNANLTAWAGSAWYSARALQGVSSGKWYWEVVSDEAASPQSFIGVGLSNASLATYPGGDANGWAWQLSGSKYTNGSASAYDTAASVGEVIGIALDMDAGTIEIYRGGVSQGVMFSGLIGTVYPMVSPAAAAALTANFGDTAFANQVPTGFNPGLYTVTKPAGNGLWPQRDMVEVLIPEGIYRTTETIVVKPHVRLNCMGVIKNDILGLWTPTVWAKVGSNISQLTIDAQQGSGLYCGEDDGGAPPAPVYADITLGDIRLYSVGEQYDGTLGAQYGVRFVGYNFKVHSIDCDGGNIGVDIGSGTLGCSDLRVEKILCYSSSTALRISSGSEHIHIGYFMGDTINFLGAQIDTCHDVTIEDGVFFWNDMNTGDAPYGIFSSGYAVRVGQYSSGDPVGGSRFNFRFNNTDGVGIELGYTEKCEFNIHATDSDLGTGNANPVTTAVAYTANVLATTVVNLQCDPGITAISGTVVGGLIVRQNGNVGNGGAPNVPYQVFKSNPTRGLMAHLYNSSGTAGSYLLVTQAGVADWAIGAKGSNTNFVINAGRNTVTDGTDVVTITTAGNVHIDAPDAYVNSNATYQQFTSSDRLMQIANDAGGQAVLSLMSSVNTGAGDKVGTISFGRTAGQSDAHYNLFALQGRADGSGASANINLVLMSRNTDRFTFTHDGKFGIGVIPSYALSLANGAQISWSNSANDYVAASTSGYLDFKSTNGIRPLSDFIVDKGGINWNVWGTGAQTFSINNSNSGIVYFKVLGSSNTSIKSTVENATNGTTAASVFEAKDGSGTVAQLFVRSTSHTTPGWGLYSNQNTDFELSVNGTKRLVLPAAGDRLVFTSAFHVTSATATGTTPAIQSGIYTPTYTTINQVDSITHLIARWARNGNVVRVSGACVANAASTAATAEFAASLPIGSALTEITNSVRSIAQLSGQCSLVDHPTFGGAIFGDFTNDRAILQFLPFTTADNIVIYNFEYEVL